ncbi:MULTISPECIES: hypothetical protein [Gammaproteobacteria]|uniref:hypothetical protein n=1 Tax=Gammaproteobacteria TaxID=1236 RepID=UPI000DD08282|nr:MULTISPECIES: hypothetical protein [Gammaproteobacteria]RTE85726.1 hypothetical protein DQX04_09755 [Aliidiomarina sp. B3213]TCZ90272.1 hypothetical protein EYQ95_10700 [Lysobacter sp. N42]
MITDSASLTVSAFGDYQQQQAKRTAELAKQQATRLEEQAEEKRQEAQELESEADRLSRDADRQDNRAEIAQRAVRQEETISTLDRQIKTVTGSLQRQTGTQIDTQV